MIKYCITFCVIFLSGIYAFCQTSKLSSTIVSKPVIDSAAIANWADLLWSEPVLSENGQYFMYPISNLPEGSKTLVVQSMENSWKKEFIGAERGFFSGNSKLAFFKSQDTLYLLTLGKHKVIALPGVLSYKNPKAGSREWLAYQVKKEGGTDLVLYNLFTGKEQHYENVTNYQFDNNGTAFLVQSWPQSQGSNLELAECITLKDGKVYPIWQTPDNKILSANSFSFDEAGKQIVFMVDDKSTNQVENQVWYYKQGMDKAIVKVTNQTQGIDSGMIVSNAAPSFSKNGKYIFFKVKPVPVPLPKPDPNAVQVDVWNYKDLVIQENQLLNLRNKNIPLGLKEDFSSVIHVQGDKTICIEKKDSVNIFIASPNNYIVTGYKKYTGDKFWLDGPMNYYLVSLKDETRTLLKSGKCSQFCFSPDGEYLIYYDENQLNLYCHNIKSGTQVNISSKIPEQIILENDKNARYKVIQLAGIKGWMSVTELFVYDKYDIWQVDITGEKEPICLTNCYGKVNGIKFRLMEENAPEKGIVYPIKKPLYLTAFNEKTKQNGFYIVYPGKAKNPEPLSMQPYLFFTTNYQTEVGTLSMKPMKATKSDVWIAKRQSVNEAPNFFSTRDFKTFKRLTSIQPQKKYNWLISELVTWKQFDGEECQGILYKPENFDSTKKYPVIISYYEKLSDELCQYQQPNFTEANLNIPWFVSREYLVFTPDIHYAIGKTGESVVNSVVSGVKYLFQFPYVDSTKVGIQGHSFGGYETNYLITHTNIFAAGVEGAGASDLVSYYGSFLPSKINFLLMPHFEPAGQYRLQSNPWNNKDAFIENSPIFNVDKITTPLLIMHNKNDMSVPWSQAIEFFIALRRLDKKVWMLQYDKGGHHLRENEAIDYTKRMTQFFDHFLKNEPMPKWMSKGIPASLKGIDFGMEIN